MQIDFYNTHHANTTTSILEIATTQYNRGLIEQVLIHGLISIHSFKIYPPTLVLYFQVGTMVFMLR
jgi:hypothetical protein